MVVKRSHAFVRLFVQSFSSVFLFACSWQSSRDVAAAEEPKEHCSWIVQAEQLLAQLARLESEMPREKEASWSREESPPSQAYIDRLLWRLWLMTGMQPLRDDDPTGSRYVQRNIVAYRKYIAEHRTLTSEEVCFQGLKNAIDSFGSELWPMTLKYVIEKTGVTSRWHLEVRTTPSRFIQRCPIDKEAALRQRDALSNWLHKNRSRMRWDAATQRFQPKSGSYVESDALFELTLPSRQSVLGSERQ